MLINVKQIGNVAVIEIAGDIDGSTAPEAQARVLAQVKPNVEIILDMSQVAYMSSAGLRMLLSTYRSVTGNNGRLVLVGLSEEMQDLMSATGFLSHFVCQDTVTDALAVFNT